MRAQGRSRLNQGQIKVSTRTGQLQLHPEQRAFMLERAAGSEDSFDAAVSALVMGAHQEQLAALERPSDPCYAIEGRKTPASPVTMWS